MDNQRWVCRIHLFQFIGTSFGSDRAASGRP
jgi:hypothetical protein